MIGKLTNSVKKIYHTFKLNKYEIEIYKHFNNKHNSITNKKNIILIQAVEDTFYYGLFGQIITCLKEKKDIKVNQIAIRNLSVGSSINIFNFLKSVLLCNRIRDKKWTKLYSSFCDDVAFYYEGNFNIYDDIGLFMKSYKIFKKLNHKQDILDIKYDGVDIGDLIYDSYLRYKPAPTVNIKDFYLLTVIFKALKNIKIVKDYIQKHNIKVLLTSYSSYIQHGIAVRIMLNQDIIVYSFGNEQNMAKELTKLSIYHTASFLNYKNDYINLNITKNNAQKFLGERLNGKIDIATSYMKESAYKIKINNIPDVKNSIIIFLHDFYDSMYNYGNLIFCDFLSWVEYTIIILEKYKIPFYLKPHPNQIKDSVKVVDNLIKKFPNAKILSSKITNKQLVDGGIKAGISMYGTVAHELTYMGIPVILSAQNPHSSYNFCFEAKSKKEYESLIKDYLLLKLPNDYKEQVESFYYMRNLNKTKEEMGLLETIAKFRQIDVIYTQEELNKFKKYSDKIKTNKAFKNFIGKLANQI
jgi:hypothetical protein